MVDIPERRAVGRADQRVVVGEAVRHRLARERVHDDMLEPVQVGELPVQRQQHVVNDQHPVAGVAGDPADLVRRQPDVERVHHCAGRRDAEITLQVRMVVPAQRRDPVAFFDAQRLQCRGQ